MRLRALGLGVPLVIALIVAPLAAPAPGEWEGGSGRVRQGESAVQAVIREAQEEMGLHVEVLDPIDTLHFYRGEALRGQDSLGREARGSAHAAACAI